MQRASSQVVATLVFLLSSITIATRALDNGLARTPPMGWLAWERYECEIDCAQYPGECIDQSLFEQMAERLVFDGFAELGYKYVNIDDCWSERRRDPKSKRLVPAHDRFSNISALAERVHSLGLHLGIYGDCGTRTCQDFPGQLANDTNLANNYYELDARTFAEWQIDSFKFDGCYMEVSRAAALCPPMGQALNATGRPMLFSCSWPAYEIDANITTNWDLVMERCNLWRAYGDIADSWTSVLYTIDYFVKQQDTVLKYHGPGHWFDADQLVIGDYGLSEEQERAHMAVWCIWASPLYMSNDLRQLNARSADILRNSYAIEVNQDPLGIFGLMVMKMQREIQVFVKPIVPIVAGCPSYAVVYLDRRESGNGQYVSVKLRDMLTILHKKLAEIVPEPHGAAWSACANKELRYNVYDIFDNYKQIGEQLETKDSLRLRVHPSGARMVKLVAQESSIVSNGRTQIEDNIILSYA